MNNIAFTGMYVEWDKNRFKQSCFISLLILREEVKMQRGLAKRTKKERAREEKQLWNPRKGHFQEEAIVSVNCW